MSTVMKGSGQSPAAPDGGQNPTATLPVGALSRAMFAQNVVAQGVPDPSPEDTSTPPPATTAGLEAPPETPLPEGATSQESTTENPPPAEEQPEQGTTETDLSQPENKLAEVLGGLDETQQSQLLDMLQSVKDGKASWNDIKSGHKAAKKYDQQLAELQSQIEQLKEGAGREAQGAGQTGPTVFAEPVAKLKTVPEVEKRLELAEASVAAIEDFLEENPDGGEVNGKAVSRQELIATKRQWQTELKQLPKRATQLAQLAQLAQARQQAAQLAAKDFPQLNDAENPDTQLARQLIKDPRFEHEVNAEYVALAMATGHRILQEQKTKRTSPAASKPVGKIQPAKPHSANGMAPARSAGAVNSKDLMARVRESGSRKDLAALLATTKVG